LSNVMTLILRVSVGVSRNGVYQSSYHNDAGSKSQ
jgi:hypothetical protein